MDKEKGKKQSEKEEEVITQQIQESYQSGLIEPELDDRMKEKK